MTRVGILEMGAPVKQVMDDHGSFPQMFQDYFSGYPDLIFSTFSVFKGEKVPAPKSQDAWIITGSPASVYEDLSWLPPMRELVCEAVGQKVPTLGICFGHQLMAQAFGGVVVKSENGVGIGVHEYDITQSGKNFFSGSSTIKLIVAHGDQVVQVPTNSVLLATSSFCTNAILSYGAAGLSIQAHPEFTPQGAAALTKAWAARSHLPMPVVEKAIASLEHVRPESDRIVSGLHKFLTRASGP